MAWRLTAGLAAVFALLAVILHQGLLPWAPKKAEPNPLALLSTKARSSLMVMEVDRRVTFCAQHVTPERSFVVFKNGSCVIVDEPVSDPIGRAKEILAKTSGPQARFITRRIEDGHLMVTYREPVFHCLFTDEIARLEPKLSDHFAGLLSRAEREAMPPGWSPPAEAKLGLLTRSSLNKDAAEMEVVKVVRSRPLSTGRGTPPAPVAVSPGKAGPSRLDAPLQVDSGESTLTP